MCVNTHTHIYIYVNASYNLMQISNFPVVKGGNSVPQHLLRHDILSSRYLTRLIILCISFLFYHSLCTISAITVKHASISPTIITIKHIKYFINPICLPKFYLLQISETSAFL